MDREEIITYIEDYTEKNVQGHLEAVLGMAKENAKNIKEINEKIDPAVAKAVETHVNGKIRNFSKSFEEYKEREEKRNEEQDKNIEEILNAVKWVGTTGKVVTGTGKIVGALVVIVGAFWALVKFVIINALK